MGDVPKCILIRYYDELDGYMVTEIPEVIFVSMGEELDTYHVLDGLVRAFHFSIDRLCVTTCDFDNEIIVKTELHEV